MVSKTIGSNGFLFDLFMLLLALVVGDCISTYLCLTTPSENYQAWEGNPISAWLFEAVGLVEGLALFVIVKGLCLIPLYKLAHLSRYHHVVVLVGTIGAVLITGWVNYNNWSVYSKLLQ